MLQSKPQPQQAVLMAPKQGLSMSDTADFKKGWDAHMLISDVCMFVHARVFVRAWLDMYARFRNAWGPHWQCFSRKHMFLADRAGMSERSRTAAQRKQKGN